jgi:hypothetical protein
VNVLELPEDSVIATDSYSDRLSVDGFPGGVTSVARVAGWPIDALDSLAAPEVSARIASVLAAQERVAQAGRQVADLLYEAVGRVAARDARRALLALRRAAFQARLPRRAVGEAVLRELPPSTADHVRAWIDQCGRCDADLAALDSWAEERLRAQKSRLVRQVDDDAYRRAVLLASPQVSAALDRAGPDGGELELKAAVSANAYAVRMATKTSPYSTLTSTAPVAWSADDTWLRWAGVGEVRTRAELALDVFEDIQDTLRARRTGVVWLRRNPSCRIADGTCRYVVRRRWSVEAMCQLALTPPIEAVLAAMGGGGWRPEALVHRLAETLGAGPDQVCTLIGRLTEAGVLDVDFGVGDQSRDPLADLAERLARAPDPDGAGRGIAALGELVRCYGQAVSHGRRTHLLRAVQQRGDEVLRAHPAGSTDRREPERQVIVEDSYIAGARLVLSPTRWAPVLDDLRLCGQLLELQDPAVGGRLLAAHLFSDRHGNNDALALLELFDEAHREALGGAGEWAGVLNSFRGVPTVARSAEERDLAWRRDVLWRWLRSRPRSDRPEVEVEVDRAVVAEAVSGRPDHLAGCGSLAAFCLPMLVAGEVRVVLNAVQAGHGRHLVRLARLLGNSYPGRPGPRSGGPVPVELAGAFSSNLNLRNPGTPYEISYPGSVSDRPDDQRLALDDLLVRPEPTSGRLALWSQRLGRQLLPVHLGAGTVKLLPPLARFILGLFGDGPVDAIQPWQALFRRQRAEDTPYGQLSPRLRVGSVVFDRRKMMLRAVDLPRRARAEPVGSYLVRVERWRRTRDVDARCFIRLVDLGAAAASPQHGVPWPAKERKPMLLDFTNPLSVLQLDRLAGRADAHAVLEEVLPAAGSLPTGPNGQRQVVELVLEMSR